MSQPLLCARRQNSHPPQRFSRLSPRLRPPPEPHKEFHRIPLQRLATVVNDPIEPPLEPLQRAEQHLSALSK
jgi:hypothetical protein